jgi:hypothetical protein
VSTDVLEEYIASNFRVEEITAAATTVDSHRTTRRHIPEDATLNKKHNLRAGELRFDSGYGLVILLSTKSRTTLRLTKPPPPPVATYKVLFPRV